MVGDVVRRGDRIGIVSFTHADGAFEVEFAEFGCWYWGVGCFVAPKRMAITARQRAIVNAAIAAEALRRIG
jgi:hypothetical protein